MIRFGSQITKNERSISLRYSIRACLYVTWLMISHLAISQAVQDRRIAPVVAQVHRVALIVGNGAYQQSPLANSVNDARDMASLLIHFGFEAELAVDLRQQLLEETIERFLGRVRPGDIALFYYSGHGIQINEQNYLVPIGFDAKDAISAKYNSYPIAQLQERLEASGAALQIVILDACRNNPFLGTRSAGGGLASMTAGRGEYIAFATSPGRTASDNPNGRNGLFTGELLSGLRESNFSLDELFNRVRERVAQKSGGTQIPWSQTSVIGEFHFSSRLTGLAGLSAESHDEPVAEIFKLSHYHGWNAGLGVLTLRRDYVEWSEALNESGSEHADSTHDFIARCSDVTGVKRPAAAFFEVRYAGKNYKFSPVAGSSIGVTMKALIELCGNTK